MRRKIGIVSTETKDSGVLIDLFGHASVFFPRTVDFDVKKGDVMSYVEERDQYDIFWAKDVKHLKNCNESKFLNRELVSALYGFLTI